MKLAAAALAAYLLTGCGSTTPTTAPPSPADTPAAKVDATAPASAVQAPASPGDPALSAAPQPTPTRDPEALRKRARDWFAAWAASEAPPGEHMGNLRGMRGAARDGAESWGRWIDALKVLDVPADTAADLQELIRAATAVRARWVEKSTESSYAAAARTDRALRRATNNYYSVLDRIWCDLKASCNHD